MAAQKQTAHKAYVAAIISALMSFIATVQGRTDVDDMGLVQWLIVIASAVVAGLTTYIVPNQTSDDTL
jgi:hypothetical protein